jgi:putative membrane protein
MRRRFAALKGHWLAIVLVIATPLLTSALTMSTVAEPSRSASGQPELRAALVNNDQYVFERIDGKRTPVAAGRLLVGELVTNDSDGFDWVITDDAVAKEGLDAGEFAAIVTIPEGFSAAYISSTTKTPQQATISVQTDGSHSYMAAILALALSQNLSSSLSSQLTESFIENLLLGYTSLGEGLEEVGKGSEAITVGLEELTKLTAKLPPLTRELASGAELVNRGLNEFSRDLIKLAELSSKTSTETLTVAEQVAILSDYVDRELPDSEQKVEIELQLAALTLTSDNAALSAAETSVGVALADSAAKELAQGSSAVATGNRELAAGMPALDRALVAAFEGSRELTRGVEKVAKKIPSYTEAEATTLSDVVANPIATETSTKPKLPRAVGAVGAVVIPIALWLGALAISFIRRSFDPRGLATRAENTRLVFGGALPFVLIGLAQAALILVGIYTLQLKPVHHLALAAVILASGVSFSLLHQGLHAIAGRFGWLISLALLAVQVLAAAVVMPSIFVAEWITELGKLLPLSQAIIGMQEVITGGQVHHLASTFIWLTVSAIVGLLLTLIAVARGRKVRLAYS